MDARGTMINPTFLLKRLATWAGYGALSFVIAAAVVLTLARVWLPAADGVRARLAHWASDEIGQPVQIGALDARLLGLTFTVVLEEVSLMSSERDAEIARFDEARLDLDLIASLRNGRPVVGGLTVAGADLTIRRHRDGSFRVHGLATKENDAAPSGAGIGTWLLSQKRLSLRDSKVYWRDDRATAGRTYAFSNVNMELVNTGVRHQFTGTVDLPEPMGRSFNFAVDVRGDITRPGSWDADAHIGATGVEPARWWFEPQWRGVAVRGGTLDLDLWGRWRGGNLARSIGQVAARDLALGDKRGRLYGVEHFSTQFTWEGDRPGWRLDIGRLRFERNGSAWEPGRMVIERDGDGHARFLSRFVRIGDLASLAGLGEVLSAEQRESLEALAPEGELRSFRIDLPPEGTPRLQGRVRDLAVNRWGRLPALSGIDGDFRYGADGGELRLASRDVGVDFANLFEQPLHFRSVDGTLAGRRDSAGGWRVTGSSLRAVTPDIAIDLALRADLPAGGTPLLDLRGVFTDGKATAVPRYLPVRIMRPKAVAWLNRAFLSGRVVRGRMLYHGRLDRFPARRRDGRFEVDFDVEGMELDYKAGWPNITGLDANVVFEGRSIRIRARRGAIYGTALGDVAVSIPDLRVPVLAVRGDTRGTFGDGIRFLRETPLARRFAGLLDRLEPGAGQADTSIEFRLPLHRQAELGFALEGKTVLSKAAAEIKGTGLRLTALKGTLDFTQDRIESERLDGRLFGEPVILSARIVENAGRTESRIALRGGGTGAAMAEAFRMPVLDRLKGPIPWQAELEVPHTSGFAGSVLHVTSALEHTALRLPPPVGKAAGEVRPFRFTRFLNGEREGEIHIAFGQVFSGALQLAPDGLRRGAIHFGGGASPLLPEAAELRLTGVLEGLDTSEWADVFPEGASGAAGEKLPAVVVKMERLALRADDEEEGTESGVSAPSVGEGFLRSVSGLNVVIERLGYGDREFTGFALKAKSIPGGLHFTEFQVEGQALELSGEGRWHYALGRSRTSVELRLSSPNVGKMIRGLGYQTALTRGALNANATLTWFGTPPDFALKRLGGNVRVKIKDGLLESIDPGAGRLLGLLSIDALPRRLFLDFSDLFQRGYRFEKMVGDLELKDGSVYTDGLRLAGPSAGIIVEGRTGLVAKDYDQTVTVLPNVADSLPVAGGIYWGPQVGAALLLLRKLLKSGLEDIAQYRYRVTGTWDEPVVERMKSSAERES